MSTSTWLYCSMAVTCVGVVYLAKAIPQYRTSDPSITGRNIKGSCLILIRAFYDPIIRAFSDPIIRAFSDPVIRAFSGLIIRAFSDPIIRAFSDPIIQALSDLVIRAFSDLIIRAFTDPIIRALSELWKLFQLLTLNLSNTHFYAFLVPLKIMNYW